LSQHIIQMIDGYCVKRYVCPVHALNVIQYSITPAISPSTVCRYINLALSLSDLASKSAMGLGACCCRVDMGYVLQISFTAKRFFAVVIF